MYLLRYPYLHVLYSLGPLATVHAGSVHVQYMNCHRQYNWKSLTCLLSGNLLRWALFLLFDSLSLSRARGSERLSLEVDVTVKAKGTYL